MNTVELQNELKKRGVELTGEESYQQLQKKLAEVKKAQAGETGEEKKTASKFVWLKSKAYVDEAGKMLLQPGFYEVKNISEFPRLLKMTGTTVAIYEELPSRVLAEIARWLGVNPDKYRNDVELLKIILQEPKPYTRSPKKA